MLFGSYHLSPSKGGENLSKSMEIRWFGGPRLSHFYYLFLYDGGAFLSLDASIREGHSY